MSRQLSSLEAEVAPTASTSSLERRLDSVAAGARLRLGGPPCSTDVARTTLDEPSLKRLFGVLKDHVEAVKQLQAVLKQDQVDVEIMRQEGQAQAEVSYRMEM